MAHHPKDIISCEKDGKTVWIFHKDSYVYSSKGYTVNEEDIKKAGVSESETELPSEGPDVTDPLPDGIVEGGIPELGDSENP